MSGSKLTTTNAPLPRHPPLRRRVDPHRRGSLARGGTRVWLAGRVAGGVGGYGAGGVDGDALSGFASRSSISDSRRFCGAVCQVDDRCV